MSDVVVCGEFRICENYEVLRNWPLTLIFHAKETKVDPNSSTKNSSFIAKHVLIMTNGKSSSAEPGIQCYPKFARLPALLLVSMGEILAQD